MVSRRYFRGLRNLSFAQGEDVRTALRHENTRAGVWNQFLERAQRMGARFSVGSDTHGPIAPLERTAAMIQAASLPHERFLAGERVRAAR